MLQLPPARTANERRKVLRGAMRQLERADLYLAAVAAMEIGDREADREVGRLRAHLDSLRRYLGELRAGS